MEVHVNQERTQYKHTQSLASRAHPGALRPVVVTSVLLVSSLKALDLSALSGLRCLPHHTQLEVLLLRPSIRTIPEALLRSCSSLRRLDLSALTDLETLPSDFLGECTS